MKNIDNDLVSSCFEYVSNNANSILGNEIAYFREKYVIQHDFSNLNKAIKQIEQVYIMSGEEKLFIDRVWSVTSHDRHFLIAIKKIPATGVSIMGFWL